MSDAASIAITELTPPVLSVVVEYYARRALRNREKFEQNKQYVRTLFGSALYPSQVIMPQKDFYLKDNPSGPMTLKSARIAYKAIINQIQAPFSEKVRRMMKGKQLDYEKNLFTVGSRTANQVVADEFDEWKKRLNLRWTVADPENKDDQVFRFSGGKRYSRPNFRIYDDKEEKYLGIRTMEKWDKGREGKELPGNYPFIANDYLLITKGPSGRALERKMCLHHVNFGGLHGVGTRATEDFLRHTEWLRKTSEEAAEAEFFQILLPIKTVFHDYGRRESKPLNFGDPEVHVLQRKEQK